MGEVKNKITDDESIFQKAIDSMVSFEEGSLITGKVIQIDSDYVYLDIGYKSEGKIPISEFNKELPKLGDSLKVIFEKREDRGGSVLVSKTKADSLGYKAVLKDAFATNAPVFGKFTKVVNNGLEVTLGDSSTTVGFCPASKADDSKVEDLATLLGVESGFKILKMEQRKLILSRRDFLKEVSEANRNKFFETQKEGDVVEGVVKSFTSFGAFIDLGGFDGLLHINDMCWGHVAKPKEYVKKGDKIELIVLALDREQKKINLSLKHFTPDPWLTFSEKYHIGDIVKGKVTKLIDYGLFVEIESGIEGFVHISELSWAKRVKYANELFSSGDQIEAKILDFDIENQKISLSIKQILDNPWTTVGERYHVGQVVDAPVIKITNSGAFVKLEDGIDGFCYVEDLSWTKKIKNISSVLKVGETHQFAIIAVDPIEQRIRVGVKQLSDDPWENLANKYSKYSEITGQIISKTDFGLFVKVEGDIEGLIGINQLGEADLEGNENNPEQAMAKYNVGDQITCAVLDINQEKKRLSLSIKALVSSEQRKEMSKYLHFENDDEPTATLEDFIK